MLPAALAIQLLSRLIRPRSLILTRFLYANRYPLRSKTLWKEAPYYPIAQRRRLLQPYLARRLDPTERRGCGRAGDRFAVALPDRHAHRVLDQGRHGDADSGL